MSLGIDAGSKAVLMTTDFDDYEAGNVYIVGPYYPERLDGKSEGVYIFQGESIMFGIGSASYYHLWRSELSLVALNVPLETVWDNLEAYVDQPFYELLDFSDNEGAIGPITSRKLAEDFVTHAEHMKGLVSVPDSTLPCPADQFIKLYDNFQHAFTLAADDGFVIFE